MKRPGWFTSLTQQGSKPPYLLKYRSADWFIIGTVSLAVFTDMFLYGVIVPVIPFALQERSRVDASRVQYWVSVLIAIYGAALLVFSPVCGWLADHSTSRRSPLLIGLVALLGATVLLNIGSNIGIWILARILQGTSAAVVWVVGLALLADTVPQEHLTQAMGYVSLGMSLGILIAPLLGGIVFDRGGYNAVFGMAYALIGVDVLLRLLLVEKKIAARWDPAAAVQVRTTARQGLVAQDTPEQEGVDVVRDGDMVVQSTDLEKGAPVISDPAAATAVNPLTILPAETESRRRRDRLPPVIGLLYSRRLLSALWAAMIQAAIFTGFDSTLTLRAAELFHWSSTGAALLFLPIAVPSFLAPLAGWLMDKFGGRYPAAAGFLLATVPLVCLGFVQENSISDKVLLCALLALTGLTLVLTFSPIMAEISAVVEDKEKKMLANGLPGYGKGGAYAQAYALFNMAFAAGCMIGPLVAGTVVEKSGWATMGWVMGLLSGVTAIPTFLWLGGWLFQKKSGDR